MGSRGSVIPFFIDKAKTGILPITDKEMTRFNITLNEGVRMVLWAIENSLGSEVFVPKIPSYRITDLAKAIGPNCKIEVTGIRPGEKIHEEMITTSDSFTTIDLNQYYAILPSDRRALQEYRNSNVQFQPVKSGFSYSSGSNPQFLSIDQIRVLIQENIRPDFNPF